MISYDELATFTGASRSTLKPTNISTTVQCRRCGAQVGEKCVQWNHRKKRVTRRSHSIRRRDAEFVREAVRALTPE